MLHGSKVRLPASALVLLLGCLLSGSVRDARASSRPEASAPRSASIRQVGVSRSQPGLDAAVPPDLNPSRYPRWWTASPPGIAAYGSIAIAALLLLLFVYRRHRYILQWMFSWVLRAVSLFAVSIEYASESIRLGMLGFSHFLSIASALLLVMSADTYRRRSSIRGKYALGMLPLLIWFTLAPLGVGPRAVVVPGYLISAATLGIAGVMYLGARRAKFLGAVLVGSTLVLLSSIHTWIALSMSRADPTTQVPLELLALNALLFLFSALGMHLLAFEEMTQELRVTNHRLEAARAELLELVITDPLTGCYNRRFFDEVIGRELQRHQRYRTPLSLLFVDIDHFKAVNDTFGHEAGDLVLQYVAGFLRRHVREADYLFRWGGDEFLVLMSCNLEQAMQKGIDLKAAFHTTPETAQLPAGVGLSLGCTEVPADADDVMPSLRDADERMYRDKMGAR